MQPKTITTYLINGEPNGLRTVFISNKACKALIVPREDFENIKARDEAKRPSVYFLVSRDDPSKIYYVGEGRNFYDRLKNHRTEKDSWDVAISFFSQKENPLSKESVQYLEYLSLKTVNSWPLLNKNNPSKPHLPEHQQAPVDEFFEDVKLITGLLGYSFFVPKPEIDDEGNGENIFYCKASETYARCIFKEGFFILFKGSKIKSPEGNLVELAEDKTFSSPSSASNFVTGYSTNGWICWKNKDGKTLDEIYRKGS